VVFLPTDNIGTYIEGFGNFMNWRPLKETASGTYTANGTTQPSSIWQLNLNSPNELYLPYSSIGINIGIQIRM
jgi:hypothetical protein